MVTPIAPTVATSDPSGGAGIHVVPTAFAADLLGVEPARTDERAEQGALRERGAKRNAFTPSTHGTADTLSPAIVVFLAEDRDCRGAIRGATSYVTACIAAAELMRTGAGRGPVHHFHESWGTA